MLRLVSVAILIVTGGALGAVLLCALILAGLLAAAFALSGIGRRMARSTQVLDW